MERNAYLPFCEACLPFVRNSEAEKPQSWGIELQMADGMLSCKDEHVRSNDSPRQNVGVLGGYCPESIRQLNEFASYLPVLERNTHLEFVLFSLNSTLRSILLLQQLRNSRQLNVTRTLIYSPNLTIPEHLLCNALSHEAHTSHPFNCLSAHPACYLRSV